MQFVFFIFPAGLYGNETELSLMVKNNGNPETMCEKKYLTLMLYIFKGVGLGGRIF